MPAITLASMRVAMLVLRLVSIIYRGRTFKVKDYDDYMEQHRTIRLVGEFYE